MQLIGLVVLATLGVVHGLQTIYMEEVCGSAISLAQRGEEAIILRLSRNPTHRPNVDCVVAIDPPLGKDLSVTFRDMDIESAPNGQCTTDFLRLYDGRSGQAQFLQGVPNTLCGTLQNNLNQGNLMAMGVVNNNQPRRLTSAYETRLGYLTVQFQSRSPISNRRGFELLVSAFRRGTGTCDSGESRCNNNRCINGNLRCSGYDHCGDGTWMCPLTAEASIGIGIVCAVVVIIIIIIVVVCVVRKKRRSDNNDVEETKKQRLTYNTVASDRIRVKTISNGQQSNP